MSSQWHYTEKGQQRGPISAGELKAKADNGGLGPNDLVWKEGMAEWVPASKVKGLLGTPQAAAPSPPPLPPTEAVVKPTGVLDALKTTGRLAVKQAERTKLVTISLAGAYHRLGKAMYEANIGREVFAQQLSALDALKNQMAVPATAADPASQPQGLAQQAKGMANATAEAAQRKVAKTRFDHTLSSLGKAAYEKRTTLTLPQAETEVIDSLLQRVSAIDADIQQLSANKPGWSLFDNRFVHVLLLVPCFPIGLFFIWRSGQWSRRAKLLWTGGAMAVVVIWAALVLSVPESQEIRAIADGDRLWEAGEKDAAVEKYLVVVNDWMPLGVDDDLPRVYARVIDYAATNDDKTLATIVIEKAFKDRLTLHLHESKAKQWSAELVSTLRAKKEEEEKGERRESERGQRQSVESSDAGKSPNQTIDKIRKDWEKKQKEYGLPHGQKEWDEMDKRARKKASENIQREKHNTNEMKKMIESRGEYQPNLRRPP